MIHQALQQAAGAGKIRYEYTDDIGYFGDMERVLREVAGDSAPAAIFGDAYGNEEAVRRVAAEYPATPFIFGSGLGPSDPNLSVFDDWIHEPAYLCGMLAGELTKSNTIGAVAGFPVAEVNRLVNAFTAGVAETNPEAQVRVTFINNWLDPPKAGQAARAQIATDRSIVVENNFGYRGIKSTLHGSTSKSGIARIDLDGDGNGCHTVWTNWEESVASAATQKMSLANGFIYAYTKSKGPVTTDAYYFTAVDFETGKTVYKVLAGTGSLFSDHLSVLYLGPNKAVYVGVLGGTVTMRDGE